MIDLALKNGKIVGPSGIVQGEVGISQGKIVLVGGVGSLPEAGRTMDVGGNYLLPGLVDPEGHLGMRALADDFQSETKAAVAGGVTTWGIQASSPMISGNPQGEDGFLAVMDLFRDLGDRYSMVDYYITPIVVNDREANEIPELAERFGVTSFKYQLHMKLGALFASAWPHLKVMGHQGFDDGTVYLGLENAARIGPPGIVCFHCENWEIARLFEERLKKAGRKDMKSWDERSPHFCEAGHVRTYAYYAKITKTPIYIQHVTTQETIDEIQRARAEGVHIYGQTSACYLSLDHNVWKINVPLRDRETIEKLWVALQNGLVDCSGTDHVNNDQPREKMEVKGDVWATLSGFPSRVEAFLPVMLSEGVNRGRMSLARVVEVCCENPARIFGLYPKKGVIAPGSDADLLVVDLNLRRKVSKGMIYSSAGWSIYEGQEMQGWPVMSLLRGEVIMEWPAGQTRARMVGEPRGRYIPRRPGHRFLT